MHWQVGSLCKEEKEELVTQVKHCLTHLLISSEEETLLCVLTYGLKCYLVKKKVVPSREGMKGWVYCILYKSNEISNILASGTLKLPFPQKYLQE
jgi:hypothetical protein